MITTKRGPNHQIMNKTVCPTGPTSTWVNRAMEQSMNPSMAALTRIQDNSVIQRRLTTVRYPGYTVPTRLVTKNEKLMIKQIAP